MNWTTTILAWATISFSVATMAGGISPQYKGDWVGFSKSIYSIFGNLSVNDDVLDFEKKGKRSYVVVTVSDDSVILELNEPVDCGRFARLGPIKEVGDTHAGFLEFSVFETREKALAPKQFNKHSKKMAYRGFCVWGLYSR